jgi:hypothetical protein
MKTKILDLAAMVVIAAVAAQPAFAVAAAPEPEVVAGPVAVAALVAGYRMLRKFAKR